MMNCGIPLLHRSTPDGVSGRVGQLSSLVLKSPDLGLDFCSVPDLDSPLLSKVFLLLCRDTDIFVADGSHSVSSRGYSSLLESKCSFHSFLLLLLATNL